MQKSVLILLIIVLSCLILPFYTFGQQKISLKNALEIANRKSLFIQNERLNIKTKEAELVSAKILPNLEFNTQLLQLTDQQYHTDNYYLSPSHQQLWFQLTTPLKIWGQRKNEIQIAKENIVLAEKNSKDYQRLFMEEVSLKWLDAWYDQQNVQILTYEKSDIDNLIKVLPPTEDEQNSKNELIRSQILLVQYDILLKTARKNLGNQLNQLKFMIGQDSIVNLEEIADFSGFDFPTNLEAFKASAFEKRSDLQVYKQNQYVAEKEKSLAKSNVFGQPVVGWVFNPQNTLTYQGLFLTFKIPIFDRNQGELKKAEVNYLQTTQSITILERQMMVEIENTWNDYILAVDNLRQAKNVAALALQDLENTKAAYQRRETDILDFLEAERSLYDAEIFSLDTELELYKTMIRVLTVANLIE